MQTNSRTDALLGEAIYTLAQSGTNNIPHSPFQPNVIVRGEGTDCSDTTRLYGRVKRKMKTQYLTTVLADIANKKGDTERAKAYWNAWHCYSKVFQKEGKLYGRYCKSRFCLVCLANRKADIINRYHPTLSEWEDPHFLTLTVKSVKAKYLNKWIEEGLIRGFRIIRERCKKRHQRGNAPKLIGVKSLECNYNPVKKTYNPHFHIIVPNRETAEILREEWMIQWTKEHTIIKAQYIRKVGDLESDLIEIIKYGSKIFTDPEMKKQAKSKFDVKIYAAALDNIFVAMKGHRLFDRFGFNLPKKEKGKKGGTQKIIVDYDVLDFESGINDWVNIDSGELLTGYKGDGLVEYLMKNNIDKESI